MIFHAILERPPVPPARINPEVPPKLEEIINRAMEKDRDLRYQSASDLRSELKRLKRDTSSGTPTAVAAACGPVPLAPGGGGASATVAAVTDSSSDRALAVHLAQRHKKALLGGLAIVALTPEERAHHKQLTKKLLGAKGIVETEKGYESPI